MSTCYSTVTQCFLLHQKYPGASLCYMSKLYSQPQGQVLKASDVVYWALNHTSQAPHEDTKHLQVATRMAYKPSPFDGAGLSFQSHYAPAALRPLVQRLNQYNMQRAPRNRDESLPNPNTHAQTRTCAHSRARPCGIHYSLVRPA